MEASIDGQTNRQTDRQIIENNSIKDLKTLTTSMIHTPTRQTDRYIDRQIIGNKPIKDLKTHQLYNPHANPCISPQDLPMDS